jgi:hypothetical protein
MRRPAVLATAILIVTFTGALACHREPPAETTSGSTDTIQSTPTGTSGTTATETGGGPPVTTTTSTTPTTTTAPPATTNTAPVTTTTAATSTTGKD